MSKLQLTVGKLIVKKSPIHGFGVFADQDFQAGDIIEECYALACRRLDPDYRPYYFGFEDKVVLLLGFGSIYNHSIHTNANYEFDAEHFLCIFKANCKIKKGEEIFISYGDSWFDIRQMMPKETSWKYKLKKFKPLAFMLLRFSVVASGVAVAVMLSAKGM